MGLFLNSVSMPMMELRIPNVEIESIYKDSITRWFDQKIEKTDRSPLIHALETSNCEAAEDFPERSAA